MDVRYLHGTNVHVVRACYNEDSGDLLAVGGDHSVDVLHITGSTYELLASFHVGKRITALAWSPKSVSPSANEDWVVEVAAATDDYGLHLLTKSFDSNEYVFPFGGGLSGHHGRVNDVCFCGGSGDDASRYVATVSDDKMLLVWDLYPTNDIASPSPAPESSPPPPQPTALPIPFAHPLTALDAHPQRARELLVADARGAIFVVDWRAEPGTARRHAAELLEPRALADAAAGRAVRGGSVAWSRVSPDAIGAAYGSRWALWDLETLQGGKPSLSGPSFPDGTSRFRWCPTFPDIFALTAASPARGAVLNVHNAAFPSAPSVFTLAPRPLRVRDFDFLGRRSEVPRIAAALGREVVVFSIGQD